MTATALASVPATIGAAIEQVLVSGNLASLTAEQRVSYYNAVCASVGLNPLTRPFDYITLNGKLTLYARRDCTDQLRKIHGVSIRITARELVEDVYVVTAQAADKAGRTDEAIGAVPIKGLTGEPKANAMMKAETKAKRRVTLSVCGLGMLDENEVASVPGATAPAWTSGVENAAPHVGVMGLGADELPDHVNTEYTDRVDVLDPRSGEVVKQGDRLTSVQLARIEELLGKLGHLMDDSVPGKKGEPGRIVERGKFRKKLRERYVKDDPRELATFEATWVIDWLVKCVAKYEANMVPEAVRTYAPDCGGQGCGQCLACEDSTSRIT